MLRKSCELIIPKRTRKVKQQRALQRHLQSKVLWSYLQYFEVEFHPIVHIAAFLTSYHKILNDYCEFRRIWFFTNPFNERQHIFLEARTYHRSGMCALASNHTCRLYYSKDITEHAWQRDKRDSCSQYLYTKGFPLSHSPVTAAWQTCPHDHWETITAWQCDRRVTAHQIALANFLMKDYLLLWKHSCLCYFPRK